MKAELQPGFIEEVTIRLIKPSPHPLRENLGPINELADSISKKGLLEPILIRPIDQAFEIIAGNRRLKACKTLGMRKIMCHILYFDDKGAYEASLIENLQQRNLNAVEEARAFKKYVDDYGYGGESELARKIGKSEQYVSQRLRLLTLPQNVLSEVTRRLVNPSQAYELLGLEEDEQRALSDFVAKNKVPSKMVRKLAKEVKSNQDPFSMFNPHEPSDRRIYKTLQKTILLLKTTMIRLDDIIDHVDEENWVLKETLAAQRVAIHQQIDELIRLRIKLNKAEYVKAF